MQLCYLEALGLPIQRSAAKPLPVPATEPAAAAKPPVDVAPVADREMKPQNALQQPAQHATRPLYMDGTYVFQCEAQVLELVKADDLLAVELDQTVFHPQGGGQPSDTGKLMADGLPDLQEGVIRHDCKANSADDLEKWLKRKERSKGRAESLHVRCQVDEAKRRLNARLHSAGHLLDVAIYALGFRWQAGKGYHFEEGPYVEYIPTQEGRQLDMKDAKAKGLAMDEISAKMKELISKSIVTDVSFVEGMRTVSMDGVSCGCGGTHVESSQEIGAVNIKKIQSKQGNIRVSYAL
eukprot:Skav211508  [mRNA]  locus=scaffold352:49677:53305:- [translate_table: standard]